MYRFGLRLVAIVLGLVIALAGCGYRAGKTGAEEHLVQLLRKYGARIVVSNHIPALEGRYVIRWDDNGCEARLYNVDYAQVEAWFVRLMGHRGERVTTVGGRPGCMFRATEVGVGLIMADMGDHIRVHCVRPLTNGWPFAGP